MEWAEHQPACPSLLLAAGLLRLACHFDRAGQLLHAAAPVSAEWQPMHANELAALAWHRGDADKALALWQSQPDSVPVLFNRGMALLFLGRPASARPHLTAAVEKLPDSSAWHHLGQLYLALTQR
jgi:hypothetical protein